MAVFCLKRRILHYNEKARKQVIMQALLRDERPMESVSNRLRTAETSLAIRRSRRFDSKSIWW